MKHILITGSTDGIGKLTAEQLAKKQHTIIIHGRNPTKLDHTIEALKRSSENPNIHGVVADLSDFNELQNISNYLINNDLSLDILINNAGVFKSNIAKNKNGLDLRFMVNYLAPFHLTNTLLPIMNEGADKRIINLSSAAQETVSIAALKGEREVSVQSAYAQSKLALTMWSFHLAQSRTDISTIPVNPGSLLNTKMVREAYGKHWSPMSKGADVLTNLAVDEAYADASGKYFDNDLGNPYGTFGQAHPDAYDQDLIDTLIEQTQSIVKAYTGNEPT